MVGTSVVSAYLPGTVSDKDPNSGQGQVQGRHRGMLAVLEVSGHIVVVVVHVGRYAGGKDMVFDPGGLVGEDNSVAVATELGQVGGALVLDDIHLVYLHRLSYWGVVKNSHLVVLEGAYAASHG